jgi:hypothetical protein
LAIRRAPARERDRDEGAIDPVSWKRRATWIALAFVPSILLAGASSHLSLDLAPLPLLWVVPLAIYLTSFVLAFSERAPSPPPWLGRAACLAAVVLVFVSIVHANEPVFVLALLHLAFLFGASWLAHRRLALDAPHPTRSSEFYVCIALGGVLGTLSSAWIAPAVLPDLYEYPVAIAIACALRPIEGVTLADRSFTSDVPHVLAVACLGALGGLVVPHLGIAEPRIVTLVSFGPAVIYAYRWMPLRRRYTLCLIALIGVGFSLHQRGDLRFTSRSFFGVLRIVDEGGERHLLHGTTLHGSQALRARERCEPLAYYHPDGPLGAAFEAHRSRGRFGRTFAVGLGAGSIACYARPNEPWTFVEIDPDVIALARDPRWFTYLRESPSARIRVSRDDGRLALVSERDASLSLVVVDAFSSDSVPVHLITREAVHLYLAKLEPGAWLLLHVSNRSLDLPSVVADVLAAERAHGRVADSDRGTWIAVAQNERDLDALDPSWRPLRGDASRAWTDSFSSLWDAIRF